MTVWSLFLLLIFSTVSLGQRTQKFRNFFDDKSKIENPFDLRDPFYPPSFKDVPADSKKDKLEINSKGVFSNITEFSPEKLVLSDLKVVGVVIGREKRVMVSPSDKDSKMITLKEGMKVGRDGAELKAILPGGIILVEKITNIYGEEEFLETVIPISK